MNDQQKETDARFVIEQRIAECYAEYQKRWLQMSPEELIRDAADIHAIQEIATEQARYFSEKEANYLLRFVNPLEVASSLWAQNRDGYETNLQDDFSDRVDELLAGGDGVEGFALRPEYGLEESEPELQTTPIMITSVEFFRKPGSVQDMIGAKTAFVVTVVMELMDDEYNRFSNQLCMDAPYVQQFKDYMGVTSDGTTRRCMLVTTASRYDGILVESEGYDYARYAAYIEDKFRLELDDAISVQYKGPDRKKHRSSQER